MSPTVKLYIRRQLYQISSWIGALIVILSFLGLYGPIFYLAIALIFTPESRVADMVRKAGDWVKKHLD